MPSLVVHIVLSVVFGHRACRQPGRAPHTGVRATLPQGLQACCELMIAVVCQGLSVTGGQALARSVGSRIAVGNLFHLSLSCCCVVVLSLRGMPKGMALG